VMEELSFLGDASLKTKMLERLHAHALADEIVKGGYWEDGKGCAVGCILHKTPDEDVHAAFESELGIPEWCARLIDRLFEELPSVSHTPKWSRVR